MESDYDRKFEEMKKYIPFLESMITRLESSNLPTNPRQAQLDKIRSLRDLLQDKKKRMKMENLLKCEQVLVNLYAKVEQRDGKQENKSNENNSSLKTTDLNVVRSKLKSVVSKLNQNTLPEIARASEMEQVSVQGSKEPALFQRRPNPVSQVTVPSLDEKKTSPQSCKKNYTRVLLSPEKSSRKWSENGESKTTEKALFSRRSPKRISHKNSPAYKRERKKSKKSKQSQSKDLNITLNVPEESLNSLDTDDILTRIINCSDGDVDIATLRELRSQILGELKQTGVKDDISDLLLKSCKKFIEEKQEVEEGELSDSESEAIENIYGSLVIVDKDKSETTVKDKARKIQICLVINSDKNQLEKKELHDEENKTGTIIDSSDFESYPIEKKQEGTDNIQCDTLKEVDEKFEVNETSQLEVKETSQLETNENEEGNAEKEEIKEEVEVTNMSDMPLTNDNKDLAQDNNKAVEVNEAAKSFTPNFYKTTTEKTVDSNTVLNLNDSKQEASTVQTDIEELSKDEISAEPFKTTQGSVEIPLLNLEATAKQEIVSEIDILQALKKEILGETMSTPSSDLITPPLHQPKITKVASAQEIVKKRISIENYKQKCNASPKPLFFRDLSKKRLKDDKNKKQSLKLTEKECERFNFPIKLPLNESSDEDDNSSVSLEDIYSDLAPKSPDHEDFADTGIKPPVIIPSDPVKTTVVSSSVDIDMRNVLSVASQISRETTPLITNLTFSNDTEQSKIKLSDPRRQITRWEQCQSNSDNVPPTYMPSDTISNQLSHSIPLNQSTPLLPNMTPSRSIATTPNIPSLMSITPNMTPIFVPNMTPNARTYEMTPSRSNFESEDIPNRKHVYAPVFTVGNTFDSSETSRESRQRFDDDFENSNWEVNQAPRDMDFVRHNDMRQERFDSRDTYGRLECPQTPSHSFGRQDCPSTPLPSFGRMDCPTTPLPSFGRTERPINPINSFGRLDGSTTPAHSYGRSDGSISSAHLFGRADGSSTPVHSFGRTDGSITPSYSFGRSDPFPRSDNVQKYSSTKTIYRRQDPRLNRKSDYDNYNRREDDREFGYYKDRKFNAEYKSDQKYSDSYRRYEQFGRNRSRERNTERYYKDYVSSRDLTSSRSVSKDRESVSCRYNKDSKYFNERYNLQREKSNDRKYSDRASSVSRSLKNDSHMSVSQSEDRSFTIDTSVNSTFQGFEGKISSKSIDARRQRAASVGRALTRECSIRRSTYETKPESRKQDCIDRRKDFLRASSVGRDINIERCENLKDIKADLLSFKLKNDVNVKKMYDEINSAKNKDDEKNNETYKKDKREVFLAQQNIKKNSEVERYSPRKNYRDPRMRRESRFDNTDKNKGKSRLREPKRSGIVYSDANISKGTILGCGVKNYKIPKIKRSPEKCVPSEVDKQVNPAIDESAKEKKSEYSDGYTKLKKNETEKKDAKVDLHKSRKEIGDIDAKIEKSSTPSVFKEDKRDTDMIVNDSSNRRITRSAKTSTSSADVDLSKYSPVNRARKCKKNTIIYDDSESDVEDSAIKTDTDIVPPNKKELSDFSTPRKEDRDDNENDSISPATNELQIQNKNVILDENIDRKISDETSKIFTPNSYQENIPAHKEINLHNNVEILSNDWKNKTDILGNEKLNNETLTPTDQEKAIIDTVDNIGSEKKSNEELNSSFGELEIFADNIASDPVLDNINALIADLDHDLDATKNNETRDQFTQEILLENMLENITVNNVDSETKCLKSFESLSEENKLSFINQENVKTEEDNISKSITQCPQNISFTPKDKDSPCDLGQDTNETPKKNSSVIACKTSEANARVINIDNNSNEAIVSTTKEDVHYIENKQGLDVQSKEKITNENDKSMPDSTISVADQSKSSEETVPDSTHESNECSDITSSSVSSEPQNKSTSNADHGDSIGKFLSILQDKSKIKELLSLLGEKASENAKIKKKLEKLSEIVSDDDDDDVNFNNDDNQKTEEKDELIIDKLDDIKTRDENSALTTENVVEILKQDNKEQTQHKTAAANSVEEKKDVTSISNENKNVSEERDNIDLNQNTGELEPECETQKGLKVARKGRPKKLNKGANSKTRITRSGAVAKTKANKPSRELLNLQADIREMFLKDDEEILGGKTGLRMCRLAKLVDEKFQSPQEDASNSDTAPVVRLEKIKNIESTGIEKKSKKNTKKSKGTMHNTSLERQNNINEESDSRCSMTSVTKENETKSDPYIFDTDSVSESICTSEKRDDSSEYESDSAASSKSEPTERTPEVKKKTKRKRSAWQSGVIVPKNRKKKNQTSKMKALLENSSVRPISEVKIPDPNCYIDKLYCFSKNVLSYSCRLCDYKGSDIVHHYKKQHPHSEIPLSRISPDIAQEAIKQCETVDFQSISKIPNHRSICRFCFKEFVNNRSLESFFWHIVSVHTGEYKHICTLCDNDKRCPFSLDIPPSPIRQRGQLTGHICGSCNYTQISLENLKTHVITRHNDEQTEVYTISLAHMTTKSMNKLLKRVKSSNAPEESEEQRVLRSSRSNASVEFAEDKSDFGYENDIGDDTSTSSYLQELKVEGKQKKSNIQSKITFENDSDIEKNASTEIISQGFKVKVEPKDIEQVEETGNELENCLNVNLPTVESSTAAIESTENISDIYELPHFKITYTQSGSKEYVCCIKDSLYHYKTPLLISFKKHVQMKHSEKWDGYCCLCKVIVTPQGLHSFKSCLQHFIDNHSDNFPVLEKQPEQIVQNDAEIKGVTPVESQSSPKPFLSVRPLSELISNTTESYPTDNASPLPVIESVVSLGSTTEPKVSYPNTETVQVEPKHYVYEEAQAEIMSKKNRIVLDAMMSHEKLVQVFKCAGRFCSYTTDSAEDALLHASTHSRVGGDNALKCAYCDFDSSDNAIDLVTHVFKSHGFCQYTCGYCFYRAAASQLVNAHIGRVHEAMPVKNVLKASFTTEPMNEGNMLSREAAVPFYVCNCGENDTSNKCKFKTYTPGKLCEHIKNKHGDVTVYECFMCQVSSNGVAELIHHYKAHGLKLYQCAWCVFGADNENELLTHASVHHPANQPKAYLRVITNKEGTTEYRVLPLAHLNKSSIPTTDVSTGVRENPVREAERSVDLEKLIGHTTTFIESMAVPDKEPPNEILQNESIISESMLNFVPQSEARPSTPNAPITLAQQSTPIIKHEIINQLVTPEKANSSDVIFCLDSDEEDHNNSDVSNISASSNVPTSNTEITSETPLLLPLKNLYKCAKCAVMSKNSSAFRTHITRCFYNDTVIPCAYCSFKGPKYRIVPHYSKVHQLKKKNSIRYDCLDCNATFTSIEQVKYHQKAIHDAAQIKMSSKVIDGVSVCEFLSDKTTSMRRKRRQTSASSGELPAKIRKFGPQDVHQLPINPIFDSFVYCSLCEFATKVRLNMVRHLQLHANLQPVPQTAPVNPVPHLETNEFHFDKMVNLASSSLVTRQEKNNKNDSTVTVLIPPERASQYPKYVHERTRHTCGAKGCSYISLDENMFKYHWETLHSGSNDFHCVHCPPNQTMDTTTALSASRIIAHLKMHDVRLYACSKCTYYHYKRLVLEKHVNETHKGGSVMIVREEISPPPPISQVTPTTAPTMDLKPWQCGLCEFKSLLRPEVAEHCAKIHNSKMQYKCVYCAFRTSNMENVTKHQSNSHQGEPAVTFYYYYREGSLADEADGTPFWKMQRKKFHIPEMTVKREDSETPSSSTLEIPSSPPSVNLSIVKEELKDLPEESIDELCKHFGQFCEPNGLSYKCPLCKNVIENTKDAMQSHLFEELQYRKWGCCICFYKAFHKRGLTEHMQSEHRQNRDPLELPVDIRVETWVAKLLEHQEAIINTCKAKLAQQKMEILKKPQQLTEVKSAIIENQTKTTKSLEKPSKEELENKFGSLGLSKNMSFCCPKCNEVIKEENTMRDHLESELNKIRWCCNTCPETFQSYHQAQFHCKRHSGQSSRPVEAPRDSTLRTAWVDAVLEVQKLSMNFVPLQPDTEEKQTRGSPEPPENSLLVVRYEERVPTPEVQSILNRSASGNENERLVITEPVNIRKRKVSISCKHCTFSTTSDKFLYEHTLRHYGLKPYTCVYCKLTGMFKTLQKHQKIYHPMKPIKLINTEVPAEPPHEWLKKPKKTGVSSTIICLKCQSPLLEMDVSEHLHENTEPEFGRVGEVIVKCSTCNTLHKDINKFLAHNKTLHPNEGNYVFYKLSHDNRQAQAICSYCPQKFSLRKDLKAHIEAHHASELKYATIEPRPSKDIIVLDDEEESMAEVTLSPSRKVARKSTTKLPYTKTVAKKSTTKLPLDYVQEYSFYGNKPSTDGIENVTTLMPFYNTLMPVTFERLKGILNIEPRVDVEKLPNS